MIESSQLPEDPQLPQVKTTNELVRSNCALEYGSLREEIINRIQIRHQILSLALSVTGIVMGFGLQNSLIALIYPPLGFLLAVSWAQNDSHVKDISKYIREHIEPNLLGLNWENYIQSIRASSNETKRQRTVLSHGGTFVFTQFMSLLIGCFKFQNTPLFIALLVIGFSSVVGTIISFLGAYR